MRLRDWPVIIGVLLLVIALTLPAAGARAALPPGVAQDLQRTASEIQLLLNNEVALANGLTNPELAAILVRRAANRAGNAMSAAVVGAIARYPAHNAEIVALAGAVAPRFRDRIAFDVARIFPGFAAGYQPVAIAYPTPDYGLAPSYGPPAPQPPISYGAAPLAAVGDEAMDDYFDYAGVGDEIYDPLESLNRSIFWFNDQIDRFLIRPIALVYDFAIPDMAKAAIARGFDNLGSPARFANDLLQGEFRDAGTTGARFLINSSIGIAGLFDVAEDFGHPAHPADFGQTMHLYGVGTGPYLVIPILGPTTLRDGFGGIVDGAFGPFSYMFETVPVNLALGGAEGIVIRESFIETLDDLKANSIDFYSALRGAYYQDRDVELRRGDLADSTMFDDAFAAFD